MSEHTNVFHREAAVDVGVRPVSSRDVLAAAEAAAAAQAPTRLPSRPSRSLWPTPTADMTVGRLDSPSARDAPDAGTGPGLRGSSSAEKPSSSDAVPKRQGSETGKHVFSSSKPLLISLGLTGYYPRSHPWVAINAPLVAVNATNATAAPPSQSSNQFGRVTLPARGHSRASSGGLPKTASRPTDAGRSTSGPSATFLPSFLGERYEQPGHQHISRAEAHMRSISEGTQLTGSGWIPSALTKRSVTPPSDNAAKRQKDESESKLLDIVDLKYRTMKVINMPARQDLTPGQEPPEPSPDNLPYGDDIDYPTSMLLYWLDEKGSTYTETARRFRLKFPSETGNDDTVRKKHQSALIKLANRHGLKQEDKIAVLDKKILRRGQQAGRKYTKIGGRVVYGATAHPDLAGTVRPTARNAVPSASRGFLKACICVWKDTSNVSFQGIRDRLADDYNWHLGANTVQKLYYAERMRVYDAHEDDAHDDEEADVGEDQEV